ncbi:MAG: hypothetical protein IJS69_02315 [Selenomonadaceae bacterium]|nr:hypothetical protein [Selenomonadaceae bacterium]
MEITVQLSHDEKKILESVYGRQVNDIYGYNPNQLEEVVELNAQEQKFFAGKNFVSPHFFVQTLYKVQGNPSPLKFNVAVNLIVNGNKNLRANFCNVGTRTIKVIHPVNLVKPEIIFRNLTQTNEDALDDEFRKIMEADMRRDFDMRHDALIRFAVYRTSDEEFAVLITLAQLIFDSFDVEKFFANVLGTLSVPKPKKFLDDLPPKNQDAIRNYWSKVLDKAPPTATLPYERTSPGAYRQKIFRTNIPADILSDLRGRAQSNRMMLTAILQSAWGFMLQLTSNRRDALFCQILSSGNGDTAPELNMIPVRVTGENNSTVEQIVRKQFRQLVVSEPYSRVDWSTLENLSGRGKKMFDHFLSFKEFQSSELNYIDAPANEQGKIISRNSWDAQGMKLGAYFRYSEKKLSISFLYDERQFVNGGVERLFALYKTVLQQMLVDWNAKFSDFIKRLGERADLQPSTEEVLHEDIRKKLRDFLSQLPVLQGRFGGTIGLFEDKAELITRYEGDRISGDMLEKNFVFVAEGKLARSVDTGDGWYNPIDIVSKNSFVNPANLLDRQRLTLSGEVLTERAELMIIPHDAFIEVLRKNPEVTMSVMNHALEQMERWQLLWLQS